MTVPPEKIKRVIASTYLEPEEYDALVDRANDENRTISGQIRHLIRQDIALAKAAA